MNFINYVNGAESKLLVFKSMVELCDYSNDSVTFWNKHVRLCDKMRLVSTDAGAVDIVQNIPVIG